MLMAMHESAKKGIVKFLIFGVMGFAVFGLLLMDVGGFFRGGVPRNTVAEVAGKEITINEFDNMLRRVLAQQGLNVETAYQLNFIERILNSEINNYLLQKAARDTGIHVGDEIVTAQIAQIIAPYRARGLSAEAALSSLLRSYNMTESAFVETIRSEIGNTILREAIQQGGAVVIPQEAVDMYQARHEQREISAVILPHSRIKDITEPEDEVLLPLYQAAKNRYIIPETREITVAFLNQKTIEDKYAISDEELQEIYEDEIASYQVPERRVLKQAILDSESDARQVLEEAIKVNDLEKSVIAITESSDAYMGEEEYEEQGLVEDISDQAFKADPESYIGPVSTPLGWHVLYVKEILPPETLPFEEVREDLERDIMQLRLMDRIYEVANEIDDQLAAGIVLEEVIEQYDLQTRSFGPVREDGSTPDDKEGMEGLKAEIRDLILETAFALLEGEVSPVAELPDGRFMTVRLDKIKPHSFQPFEDVKEEIAVQWQGAKKAAENKIRANELLNRLRNGNMTFQEASVETGYNLKKITLDKGAQVDEKEPLSRRNRENIFLLDPGIYFLEETIDSIVIGKVNSIKVPDQKDIPEDEIQAIMSQESRNNRDIALSQYLIKLQSKYPVKVNRALIDTTYGPGSENF